LKTVSQDILHAFKERHVIGGKIEASARDKGVVDALKKLPAPGVCLVQMQVLRRVGEEIICCADRLWPQERQHDPEVTTYKFDVVELEFSCITNCAVKRFLRFVYAEDVDVAMLPGPAARQDALSATEVNLQGIVVPEQLLRCQTREAVRFVKQVHAVPAIEIFRGGFRVGRINSDSCRMSSSCHVK